jgi:diguanylate cyclase (GGDEF)-like protein/PAS domain S-box-containing protein
MPTRKTKTITTPQLKAPTVAMLDGLVDGLVCACHGGVITSINAAGKKMLGYHGQGSPVGRALASHLAGAAARTYRKSVVALAKGKQPKKLNLLTFAGQELAVNVFARSTSARETLIVATRNHVAQQHAQRALATDNLYRHLADQTPEAICIVEGETLHHLNPAARAMLALPPDHDITGSSFLAFVHGDYVPALKRGHAELFKLKDRDKPEHMKLRNSHGQVVDAEMWVRLVGAKNVFAFILRDVTQRVIGVETLRASGRRLQAIVDAVADGVISVDERGLVQSVNAAVKTLFGYTPKQLIDKPLTKILPHWTDEQGVVVTRSVMGNDSIEFPASLLGRTRDVQGVRHDKTTFPAEITVTTMQSGLGSLFTVVVRDAGARKAAEEAQRTYAAQLSRDVAARTQELQHLSRQNRQILESASDGIIAVDLDGRIRTANPAAGDLFDRNAAAMVGLPVARVFLHGSVSPNAGQPVPILTQLKEGPFHADIELNLSRTNGASFDAAYVISPITEARKVMGYVVTVRDVTERKRLASEQRVAAAVFEQSSEGLCVADARGRLMKVNPAFCALTGSASPELIGRPMADALRADPKQYRDAMDALQKAAQTEWEQWVEDNAKKRRAWRVGLSNIRDDQGRTQQYAAIVSDVTARKLEEEKILYQATYDQLTGLPNRALFNDRLQRVVLEGRRGKSHVGLMFIDLDGFKAINDNLGHDAGDLLLKATAERLMKCVRESDTVARLGGDEFTVIMPLLDSIDGATLVASRILKSLTSPFDLNGQEGRVSASIGISMFPAQAGDAQQLLHNADVAMYHAKRHGKANYQIWRQELEADAEARY